MCPTIDVSSIFSKGGMSKTRSVVFNLTRILAASSAQAPLLLIGPPGVGKTKGVEFAAKLLGKRVERINFSGNTTIDSLIGSMLPTVENGLRVFKWQPGALIRALEQRNTWLLLDEINLAAPEVLDCLAPLLGARTSAEGDRLFTSPFLPRPLEIPDVRIFATMNPASIGGGRSKLPRAVKNLFAAVELDPFSDEELRDIFLDVCRDLIETNVVTQELLFRMFDLFASLKEAVKKRDIGRRGGPFEYNLRTLLQLHDIIAENASDRLYFMSQNQSSSNTSANKTENEGGATVSILCSLMDMVFASPFHSVEEQEFVRNLIKSKMGDTSSYSEHEVSIDISTNEYTRIGAVYMMKGSLETEVTDDSESSLRPSIVRTQQLLSQLQTIASATQSRRPVLIEGSTCSGKTTLVIELAQLCGQELTLIPLNQDTETSELVGQWLPIQQSGKDHPHSRVVEMLINDVSKYLLVCLAPIFHYEHRVSPTTPLVDGGEQSVTPLMMHQYIFEWIRRAEEFRRGLEPTIQNDALKAYPLGWKAYCDCKALTVLQEAIESCCRCTCIQRACSVAVWGKQHFEKCKYYISVLTGYVDAFKRAILRNQQHGANQQPSFEYVTTPLVEAIRTGKWVLFDCINSAPPEVMERLNSLFEEKPFLSLYEKAQDDILSGATIHKGFRIFCTANVERINSNKISAAMLNRCIRFWVPALDEIILKGSDGALSALNSDTEIVRLPLYQIVLNQLEGVSGAREIALFCLMFHRKLKQQILSHEVSLLSGYQLTARSVIRSAFILRLRLQNSADESIPKVLGWALNKVYGAMLEDSRDVKAMLTAILDLSNHPAIVRARYDRYFLAENVVRDWKVSAAETIFPLLRLIEINSIKLVVMGMKAAQSAGSAAIELMKSLTERIFIPICKRHVPLFQSFIQKAEQVLFRASAEVAKNIYEEFRSCVDATGLCEIDDGEIPGLALETDALVLNLIRQMYLYCESTSVWDAADRHRVLKRVFEVVSVLHGILSHRCLDLVEGDVIQSEILKQRQLLSIVPRHGSVVRWIEALVDSMAPFASDFQSAVELILTNPKARSSVWEYKRQSSRPIRSVLNILPHYSKLLALQSSQPLLIEKFQIVVDWSGLLMCCQQWQPQELFVTRTNITSKYELFLLQVRQYLLDVQLEFGKIVEKARTEIHLVAGQQIGEEAAVRNENKGINNDKDRLLENRCLLASNKTRLAQYRNLFRDENPVAAAVKTTMPSKPPEGPATLGTEEDGLLPPSPASPIKRADSSAQNQVINERFSELEKLANICQEMKAANSFKYNDTLKKARVIVSQLSNDLTREEILLSQQELDLSEKEQVVQRKLNGLKNAAFDNSILLSDYHTGLTALVSKFGTKFLQSATVSYSINLQSEFLSADFLNSVRLHCKSQIGDADLQSSSFPTRSAAVAVITHAATTIVKEFASEKCLTVLKSELSLLWMVPVVMQLTSLKRQLDCSYCLLHLNESRLGKSLDDIVLAVLGKQEVRVVIFGYDHTQRHSVTSTVVDIHRTSFDSVGYVYNIFTGSVDGKELPWQSDFVNRIKAGARYGSKFATSKLLLPSLPVAHEDFDVVIEGIALLSATIFYHPYSMSPVESADCTQIDVTGKIQELFKLVCHCRAEVIMSSQAVFSNFLKIGGQTSYSEDDHLMAMVSSILAGILEVKSLVAPSTQHDVGHLKRLLHSITSENSPSVITLKPHAVDNNAKYLDRQKKRIIDAALAPSIKLDERLSLYMLLDNMRREYQWSVVEAIVASTFRSDGTIDLFAGFKSASFAVIKVITFLKAWVIRTLYCGSEEALNAVFNEEDEMIVFARNLADSVLTKTVAFSNKEIALLQPRSSEWFMNCQSLLNIWLQRLGVSEVDIKKNGLGNLLSQLSIGDSSDGSADPVTAVVTRTATDSLTTAVDNKRASVKAIIAGIRERLVKLREIGRNLRPSPHSLLGEIREKILEAESIEKRVNTVDNVDTIDIRWIQAEPAKLLRLLEDYKATIAEKDPFASKIRHLERKLLALTTEDFDIDAKDSTLPQMHSSAEAERIASCLGDLYSSVQSTVTRKHDLRLLVSTNVQQSSWICAVASLNQMKELLTGIIKDTVQPLNAERIKQLRKVSTRLEALLCVLSDDIQGVWSSNRMKQQVDELVEKSQVIEVDSDRTADASGAKKMLTFLVDDIEPSIFAAQCSFRQKLFTESKYEILIANYVCVAEQTSQGQEWLLDQRPTVMSMYSLLGSLHAKSKEILEELRSCTANTPCTLQPIQIQFTDLVTLFFGDNIDALRSIHHINDGMNNCLLLGDGSIRKWSVPLDMLESLNLKSHVFPMDGAPAKFVTKSVLGLGTILADSETFVRNISDDVVEYYREFINELLTYFHGNNSEVQCWTDSNDCLPLQIAMAVSITCVSSKILTALSTKTFRVRLGEFHFELKELSDERAIWLSKQASLYKERTVIDKDLDDIETNLESLDQTIRLNEVMKGGYMKLSQLKTKKYSLVADHERLSVRLCSNIDNYERVVDHVKSVELKYEAEKSRLEQAVKAQVAQRIKNLQTVRKKCLKAACQLVDLSVPTDLSERKVSRALFAGHSSSDDSCSANSSSAVDRMIPIDVLIASNVFGRLLKHRGLDIAIPDGTVLRQLSADMAQLRQIAVHELMSLVSEIDLSDSFRDALIWASGLLNCGAVSFERALSAWYQYERVCTYHTNPASCTWLEDLARIKADVDKVSVGLFSGSGQSSDHLSVATRDAVDAILSLTRLQQRIFNPANRVHTESKQSEVLDGSAKEPEFDMFALRSSINAAISYVAASVLAVNRLASCQRTSLHSDFEIELRIELEAFFQWATGSKVAVGAIHLVSPQNLWDGVADLGEIELLDRVNQLKLFGSSVSLSLRQYISHTCYGIVTSTYALVEDIQSVMTRYAPSWLTASFASTSLIRSIGMVADGLITEVPQGLFRDVGLSEASSYRAPNPSRAAARFGTTEEEVDCLVTLVESLSAVIGISIVDSTLVGDLVSVTRYLNEEFSPPVSQRLDEVLNICYSLHGILRQRRPKLDKAIREVIDCCMQFLKEFIKAMFDRSQRDWKIWLSEQAKGPAPTETFLHVYWNEPSLLGKSNEAVHYFRNIRHHCEICLGSMDDVASILQSLYLISPLFVSMPMVVREHFEQRKRCEALLLLPIDQASSDLSFANIYTEEVLNTESDILLRLRKELQRRLNAEALKASSSSVSARSAEFHIFGRRWQDECNKLVEARENARWYTWQQCFDVASAAWDKYLWTTNSASEDYSLQKAKFESDCQEIELLALKVMSEYARQADNLGNAFNFQKVADFKTLMDKARVNSGNKIKVFHPDSFGFTTYSNEYDLELGVEWTGRLFNSTKRYSVTFEFESGQKPIDQGVLSRFGDWLGLSNLPNMSVYPQTVNTMRVGTYEIDDLASELVRVTLYQKNEVVGEIIRPIKHFQQTVRQFNCEFWIYTRRGGPVKWRKQPSRTDVSARPSASSSVLQRPAVSVPAQPQATEIPTAEEVVAVVVDELGEPLGVSGTRPPEISAPMPSAAVAVIAQTAQVADVGNASTWISKIRTVADYLVCPVKKIVRLPSESKPEDLRYISRIDADREAVESSPHAQFVKTVCRSLEQLSLLTSDANSRFGEWIPKEIVPYGSFRQAWAKLIEYEGRESAYLYTLLDKINQEITTIQRASGQLTQGSHIITKDLVLLLEGSLDKYGPRAIDGIIANFKLHVYSILCSLLVQMSLLIDSQHALDSFPKYDVYSKVFKRIFNNCSLDNLEEFNAITRIMQAIDPVMKLKAVYLERLKSVNKLHKPVPAVGKGHALDATPMCSFNQHNKATVFLISSSDGSVVANPSSIKIEFGTVAVSNAAITRPIQFLNQTDRLWEIIIGPFSAESNMETEMFSLSQNSFAASPQSIGATAPFEISFRPKTIGKYRGQFAITVDSNVIMVDVEAEVEQVEVCVSESELDFGDVISSSKCCRTMSFCVKNLTSIPLFIYGYVTQPKGSSQRTSYHVNTEARYLKGEGVEYVDVTCIPNDHEENNYEEADVTIAVGSCREDIIWKTVKVRARAVAPQFDMFLVFNGTIGLIQDGLELPPLETAVGSTVSTQLLLRNAGTVPVKFSWQTERLVCNPSQGEILMNEELRIELRLCSALAFSIQRSEIKLLINGRPQPVRLLCRLNCGIWDLHIPSMVLKFEIDALSATKPKLGKPKRSLQFHNRGSVPVDIVLAELTEDWKLFNFSVYGGLNARRKIAAQNEIDFPLEISCSSVDCSATGSIRFEASGGGPFTVPYSLHVKRHEVAIAPQCALHIGNLKCSKAISNHIFFTVRNCTSSRFELGPLRYKIEIEGNSGVDAVREIIRDSKTTAKVLSSDNEVALFSPQQELQLVGDDSVKVVVDLETKNTEGVFQRTVCIEMDDYSRVGSEERKTIFRVVLFGTVSAELFDTCLPSFNADETVFSGDLSFFAWKQLFASNQEPRVRRGLPIIECIRLASTYNAALVRDDEITDFSTFTVLQRLCNDINSGVDNDRLQQLSSNLDSVLSESNEESFIALFQKGLKCLEPLACFEGRTTLQHLYALWSWCPADLHGKTYKLLAMDGVSVLAGVVGNSVRNVRFANKAVSVARELMQTTLQSEQESLSGSDIFSWSTDIMLAITAKYSREYALVLGPIGEFLKGFVANGFNEPTWIHKLVGCSSGLLSASSASINASNLAFTLLKAVDERNESLLLLALFLLAMPVDLQNAVLQPEVSLPKRAFSFASILLRHVESPDDTIVLVESIGTLCDNSGRIDSGTTVFIPLRMLRMWPWADTLESILSVNVNSKDIQSLLTACSRQFEIFARTFDGINLLIDTVPLPDLLQSQFSLATCGLDSVVHSAKQKSAVISSLKAIFTAYSKVDVVVFIRALTQLIKDIYGILHPKEVGCFYRFLIGCSNIVSRMRVESIEPLDLMCEVTSLVSKLNSHRRMSAFATACRKLHGSKSAQHALDVLRCIFKLKDCDDNLVEITRLCCFGCHKYSEDTRVFTRGLASLNSIHQDQLSEVFSDISASWKSRGSTLELLEYVQTILVTMDPESLVTKLFVQCKDMIERVTIYRASPNDYWQLLGLMDSVSRFSCQLSVDVHNAISGYMQVLKGMVFLRGQQHPDISNMMLTLFAVGAGISRIFNSALSPSSDSIEISEFMITSERFQAALKREYPALQFLGDDSLDSMVAPDVVTELIDRDGDNGTEEPIGADDAKSENPVNASVSSAEAVHIGQLIFSALNGAEEVRQALVCGGEGLTPTNSGAGKTLVPGDRVWYRFDGVSDSIDTWILCIITSTLENGRKVNIRPFLHRSGNIKISTRYDDIRSIPVNKLCRDLFAEACVDVKDAIEKLSSLDVDRFWTHSLRTVLVSTIIENVSVLMQLSNVWCAIFHDVNVLCKKRITNRNDCLSVEQEFDYIRTGLHLLRLTECCKLLIHRHGCSRAINASKAVAAKEIARLRELLALLWCDRLPDVLREAFQAVNITASEAENTPFPFKLPTGPQDENDETVNDLFSNPAEKWLVEKRSAIATDVTETNEILDYSGLEGPSVESMADMFEANTSGTSRQQLGGEITIILGDQAATTPASNNESKSSKGFSTAVGAKLELPKEINPSQMILHKAKQVVDTPSNTPPKSQSQKPLGPVTFENGTSAVEDVERVNIECKTSLSKAQLRKQMETANLKDVFKVSNNRNRQLHYSAIEQIKPPKPTKKGTWTYQKLAESRALQTMISLVVEELRKVLVEVYESASKPVRIEVLCLIDDSCSMAAFEHDIFETVVLMIEVLRRLECRFAVGRFAGTHTHSLLKKFDEEFTMVTGEWILEMLGCTGKGTAPADNLANFCRDVWGGTQSDVSLNASNSSSATSSSTMDEVITHRAVLMVTDGWTNQANSKDYSDTLEKYRANLKLFILHNARRRGGGDREATLMKQVLGSVKQIAIQEVDIFAAMGTEVSRQPSTLPKYLVESLRTSFVELRNEQRGARVQSAAALLSPTYRFHENSLTCVKWDTKPMELHTAGKYVDMDLETASKKANANIKRLYKVSSPASLLPNSQALEALGPYDSDPSSFALAERLLASVANQETELNSRLNNSALAFSKDVSRAAEIWNQCEIESSAVLEELVQVLEESVLPFNKFTRRRGDFRGSSLYIPGLIKAFATDFSYKKFFANLNGGGKRQYGVSIAIDCSVSMQKFNAQCAMQSMMLLAQALRRAGIDFSLIAFGDRVRVLKTSQQEWTAVTSWMVLTQLMFEDNATLDADGVHCALDLVSSAKGPKTVFVLSDGFGTSGLRMSAALRRAANEGIQVVGIAVGLDKFHVSNTYQHWIECALPKYLPDALRAFAEYEDDGDVSPPDALWYKQFQQQRAKINPDGSPQADLTIDQILNAHEQAFDESLIEELRKERDTELTLEQDSGFENLSVDIAFLLDITGSFAPFMAAARQQILSIVAGIQLVIDEKFHGLKLSIRVAIIGYRDVSDSNYQSTTMAFRNVNNEQDIEEVKAFLQRLIAEDGDDIPEDVNGALISALGLDWQAKSKTIVLITDAPGHGSQMAENWMIDDKPGTASPKQYIDTMIEKEMNLFFCYASKVNTSVMQQHLNLLYTDKRADRELVCVPLIDEAHISTPDPIIFILCLDESGSMGGAPFEQLRAAYREFIRKRKIDQGGSDRIAVINFASSARFICGPTPVDIRQAPDLPFASGGTMFGPALQLAKQVMGTDTSGRARFVMLFMTDGQSGDNVGASMVGEIARTYPNRFTCHTVGFGTGVNVGQLQAMTAGGGKYHAATVGNELVKAFQDIASDSNSANVMAATLAKNIMDSVVTKLVVDYL
jgi:MoxR-like ATPase/uncharacterized protein YegL